MKNKLILLIPTKNEEERIRQCILSAIDIVDEIYVIDSFSTDNTTKIATELGAKILTRKFDNYSSQKNWALEQIPNEWILLLDADESLSNELKIEILNLIQNNKLEESQAYWVYRRNYFFNQPINYSGYQNDKVIRLFKKSVCKYINNVHENLIVNGKVDYLKHKLLHNTYRGFDFHIQKIGHYATLQALDYDNKTGKLTLYHFILKPFFRFFKHYFIKQGFRDGTPGLILSVLSGYATFLRYVKLWMLRKNIKY